MPVETVSVDDSILNSVKKLIGPDYDYGPFDRDLIMHINSAFMILNQLGLGPNKPYRISGSEEVWTDFMSDVENYLSVVDYIYLRCRLIFDPPSSSFVLNSLKEQQQELEWRLNVMAETPMWDISDSTQTP